MKKTILIAIISLLSNLVLAEIKKPTATDLLEIGKIGDHSVALNLIQADVSIVNETQTLVFKKVYNMSFDMIDGIEDAKFRTESAYKICGQFASEDTKILKESKLIHFIGQVNQLLENKTDEGFNSTQFICTSIFQASIVTPKK